MIFAGALKCKMFLKNLVKNTTRVSNISDTDQAARSDMGTNCCKIVSRGKRCHSQVKSLCIFMHVCMAWPILFPQGGGGGGGNSQFFFIPASTVYPKKYMDYQASHKNI